MFSSNTETNITATYQDSDGTIDLVASGGSSDSIADADNDTKIQVEESSDEDKIRFDVAGTERMVLDGTGRLLIGTSTSPNNDSDNAHYAKLIAMGNTNAATGDGRLTLARGEASADLSSGDVMGMIAFADNTFHDFALIKCVTDAATGNDDNAGALVFETVPDGSSANAERMRITNAGRIGIGTDAPVADVELRRSQASTSKLLVRNTSSDNAADAAVGFLTQGNVDFTVGIDQSAGSLFKISKHETLGNNDALIINSDSHVSISAAKRLYLDGLGDTYISEYSANEVEFVTGGTRRFHLSAGNGHFANGVTVGTSTFVSNSKFTVDGGDMMVQAANNSMGISDLLPGYTRGDYGVVYSTANNIYFAVGSSYLSYIGGGSGQYTVSDERMKENVTTLSGTLDKVKQLRGVSHTWKDTEQMGTDTQIGMIAQEVEKIYPELVGDGGLPNDNEGNAPMKSVNYPHLTSVLVEAIKEQQTIIDDLKTRIEALES